MEVKDATAESDALAVALAAADPVALEHGDTEALGTALGDELTLAPALLEAALEALAADERVLCAVALPQLEMVVLALLAVLPDNAGECVPVMDAEERAVCEPLLDGELLIVAATESDVDALVVGEVLGHADTLGEPDALAAFDPEAVGDADAELVSDTRGVRVNGAEGLCTAEPLGTLLAEPLAVGESEVKDDADAPVLPELLRDGVPVSLAVVPPLVLPAAESVALALAQTLATDVAVASRDELLLVEGELEGLHRGVAEMQPLAEGVLELQTELLVECTGDGVSGAVALPTALKEEEEDALAHPLWELLCDFSELALAHALCEGETEADPERVASPLSVWLAEAHEDADGEGVELSVALALRELLAHMDVLGLADELRDAHALRLALLLWLGVPLELNDSEGGVVRDGEVLEQEDPLAVPQLDAELQRDAWGEAEPMADEDAVLCDD